MKKKVRFNLLDAAILLVAVGLVLSFVFRAELARIVSGAEEAAYTVTFTVVTTPENADALAVGARLTDGDGNVFAGEVTALSPAEGFGALAGQRALSVQADMRGYTKDGADFLAGGTRLEPGAAFANTADGRELFIQIGSVVRK